MTTPLEHPRRSPAPGPTVTKALRRAADLLGLSQADVAEILGVSKSTASRLFAGQYELTPARKKEWELALLFVRLFRSLDAVAGHGPAARAWLEGPNLALSRPPLELVKSAEGLVRVVQYLDSVRGRV
jgi:transcriptional regulator with XRE-family HTH domain